ncbi:hypothetical protein ACFVQ3_18610 [Oerskovia sp. NPDC057915]|uniref:hypothetical protein n=1 Tax=Oerskovia sp. NPDC057915 TaxID=3346280 RepID=UPI0036D7A4D4
MPNFVIEFNRKTRDRKVSEFPGAREAMERRLELETERTDSDVEIVALSSDSLETLTFTHSRYFTGNELITS